MKLFSRKFLSEKKYSIVIGIFILVIGLPAMYTLYGIYSNVQDMKAAEIEDIDYFPDYPIANTTGKDTALIKRGEYLTKAGDCIACHTNTPEKGKPFAGGLPMVTPFGTIYTHNITPDKETGIGNWTDEQFIKAMREGISPEGHYYYPAFPYLFFNKITTEDLKAIKAYLDSIPAIHQKNPENKMIFPFNWRFLQLGWRMLFFNRENTGPLPPDPQKSDEWNRAVYLVEGLGHCAMCHSPSYNLLSSDLPLGAPIRKYDLSGAKVQGYLAPNITKKNLDKVPLEEIIEVFTKDKFIGGGAIKGPMLEVNRDSLRYLTHSDLMAIAKYLKNVQTKTPPKPRLRGGPGQGIYETYCSGCHTTGAGGAPKYGDASSWGPLMQEGIEKVYANAINGFGGMPAKGTCLSCTDEEIKQAVDYMVAIVKGGKYTPVEKIKLLTINDGKKIYEENCSACHNIGFKGAPKPGDKEAWAPIIEKGFLETYANVITGRNGHPIQGACDDCSDDEIKAAVKYMMQVSSTDKNFNLW